MIQVRGRGRNVDQRCYRKLETSLFSEAGFTLIEMMVAIALTFKLLGFMSYAAIIGLRTMDIQAARKFVKVDLSYGIDRLVRELRLATAYSLASSAIRWTRRISGSDQSFILYWYHASDTYPPAFSQSVYELRRASLSGGISGTFTYGDGTTIIDGVRPPTTSSIALSSSTVTFDLTTKKDDDEFRVYQQVTRRN